MRSSDYPKIEQIYYIVENKKVALQLMEQGKISNEKFQEIEAADRSPTKKYMGWMAKQWATGSVSDMAALQNLIDEYHTFITRGVQLKYRDINQYKTFAELHAEIQALNDKGEGVSNKAAADDYDTIQNDENLLIMSPHNYFASRKLALKYFAYRTLNPSGGYTYGDNGTDSSWCITYKNDQHFTDYYYSEGLTMYYIKVKPESKIRAALKEKGFNDCSFCTAVLVNRNGTLNSITDAANAQPYNKSKSKLYLTLLGMYDPNLFKEGQQD